jgi:hypothetical protein
MVSALGVAATGEPEPVRAGSTAMAGWGFPKRALLTAFFQRGSVAKDGVGSLTREEDMVSALGVAATGEPQPVRAGLRRWQVGVFRSAHF